MLLILKNIWLLRGRPAKCNATAILARFPEKVALALLCLFVLPLPALGAELPRDRLDGNFGFAAYVAKYDEPALKSAPQFAFRLGTNGQHFQGGFEVTGQYSVSHSYRYPVPYGSVEENRDYSHIGGALYLRLLPISNRFFALHVGGLGGGAYLTDTGHDAVRLNGKVAEQDFYYLSATSGIDFFPTSFMSLYLEGRRQFHLKGTVIRERMTSIDLAGNERTTREQIHLNAWLLGAGLRFNF